MRGPSRVPSARRGAIPVVLAGLVALAIAMGLVVTRRVSVAIDDGALVLRDARARTALPAALTYILERARLGVRGGGEAHGWVDVRDGAIGPLGPRDAAGNLPSLVPDAAPYQTLAGGTWPLKGSILRAPLQAWLRPPAAVAPDGRPGGDAADGDHPAPAAPRPLARTLAGFFAGMRDAAGEPILAPEAADRAWFRLRREGDDEHDGDGRPAYDREDHGEAHALFLITCGSGGTEGFRDWEEAEAYLGAAGARTRFGSAAAFAGLRAAERLLWYRCRWTADDRNQAAAVAAPDPLAPPRCRIEVPVTAFGRISWVEALADEPTVDGRPIW